MEVGALLDAAYGASSGGGCDLPAPVVVHRVHHQGVAFPMAHRIAVDLPRSRRKVLAIERDDMCLMNHLKCNQDETRRLNDLISVVVPRRKHSTRNAARQAAVPCGQVLPVIA